MQNDNEDSIRASQSRFDDEIRDKFDKTEVVAITFESSWPPSEQFILVTKGEKRLLLDLQKKYNTLSSAIEKLGKDNPTIKTAIAVSKRKSISIPTLYF